MLATRSSWKVLLCALILCTPWQRRSASLNTSTIGPWARLCAHLVNLDKCGSVVSVPWCPSCRPGQVARRASGSTAA